MPFRVTVSFRPPGTVVAFQNPAVGQFPCAFFVAAKIDRNGGCAIVPFRQHYEGSTLFLPTPVDHLFAVRIAAQGQMETWMRHWSDGKWSEPLPASDRFDVRTDADRVLLKIHRRLDPPTLHSWAKNLAWNSGWGALILPNGDKPLSGDQTLPPASFKPSDEANTWHLSPRPSGTPRVRIYQLLPRLFSNINETRKPNGTLLENGCGKFPEITDRALASLRDELNITHIWLTGVHAHATATDYPDRPADDPDVLKGVAGSPYAIKDYGDVCPDYAIDPSQRLGEFRELITRIHAAGLRVIMDFVPNHVARSHASTIVRLGDSDNRALFFAPHNNFFWLQPDSPGGGPPLRLPMRASQAGAVATYDGLFEPERLHGRVTGNNAATWSPSTHDWFETVKLNYGYDFTTGQRAFPHAAAPTLPIPDTWQKMDRVLAYWQEFGVDGFRCDMAHMIPPEFWRWAVGRARERNPHVTFIAEAYNNDLKKVEGSDPFVAGFGSVNIELLNAGFDAVYDDPAYKALKNIYDGSGWANDLDGALGVRDECITPDYVFHRSLRYPENHDEVRLASPLHWAGVGMNVGRPVSAILFGLSRGPVLVYSGQEVGEPAVGAEGFSGDDGRTSIFDYWSMPEFTKWVNGHAYDGEGLSPEQRILRAFYGRLLSLVDEPAFRDGDFIPLNPRNVHNPAFGRLPGEPASGHWLYAFVRHDRHSGQFCLVVANLHPTSTFEDVWIELSPHAATAIKPKTGAALQDHLTNMEPAIIVGNGAVLLPNLPPLSAGYFAITAKPNHQLGGDGDQLPAA